MKTIVATAAAAALLIATPAFAAKRVHSQARAQSGEYLAAPSGAVISGDKLLGQDPDPNIRTGLMQQGDISAQ